jgi:hypothetical protein
MCPSPPPAPRIAIQSPGRVFVFIIDEYMAIPAIQGLVNAPGPSDLDKRTA